MAATPPFDPAKLPDDPRVLRELLLQVLQQLRHETQRNEVLEAWNRELRVRLFGRKSESLSDEENQRLLEFGIDGALAIKPQPKVQPPPKPQGRGHGRARLPAELPRDVVVLEVPARDRRCGCCGKALVEIDREETEKVDYQPASVHVKKFVRVKYGCPDSECRGTVMLAELPKSAVPKSKAAEGMLAFVATAKMAWHLPLYRLEEFLANHGLPVGRSTLWEWEQGLAKACEPIVAVMEEDVKASPVVETDETPVPLRDQEHGGMKKGRQWTYINRQHTVFDFSADRKRKHPTDFLARTKGTILTDADLAYRAIAQKSQGRLINAFCMAHLRRLFFKALGSDRERALVGMAYIRALYEVEREGEGLSPTKLRRVRQRKSRPILSKFKGWIDEEGLSALPKSPIGKALGYAQKNWKELCRFLEDGRLRIDNNRSENALRGFAVGRKNWLRFESERGGRVAAILASLVASCRRHGKNPFEYFRDVLRRLPTHPPEKMRELTPARWKPKPDSS